ncbi:MAG: choice-of-anchor D domain-containing protein, partial [Lysobacter sp.]|nr:choice-of-anchor D domain-containing protein [Lysobacter sp.]
MSFFRSAAAATRGRLVVVAVLVLAAALDAAGAYPWPVWTPDIPAVAPSSTGKTYYVDGAAGSNTNNGTTPATSYKTIAKAVSMLAEGDTILIRKGLYREAINLSSAPSGTAAKPITVGSYGDGEVIVDGSTRVTGWTIHGGTVWKAPIAFTPVGIVVNEVPLKQVTQGQGGSTAPQVGLAGVTSGSGKWYVGGGFIYADMGTTLGAGDPNSADIVVPSNVGNQEHVFWYDQHYLRFKGLTVRGSGSNGLWGYGSNVTVESCNIKFNGKAAVSFLSSTGIANSDNAVLTSHAYHNNLVNWPRGNNGFAEDGGGWPGTLVWDTNLRPLARGNIVHKNGGEGIITYGTAAGLPSGSALFEQNVVHDNWSVNMYFDNQPDNVARNNYLFNHPPDNADFLYVSGSAPWNSLDKFTVCLMLADEQNSSDSTGGYANLSGSRVHNNIIAGCRIGIRDYSEGTQSIRNHGLRNTVISNNTIIMPFHTFQGGETFGIFLQDNKTPSGTQRNTNSRIQNNAIHGFNGDMLVFTELKGAQGLLIDNNNYFSAAAQPFGAGFNSSVTYYNFAGWKAAITGADPNSVFADPLFADVTQFRAAAAYDYAGADLLPGSPSRLAGTSSEAPATDFRGTARTVPPSIGALEPTGSGPFALAPSSLDFGGQSMGTTSPSQTVTITNTGSSALTVSSASASTWFSVSHDCNSLAAGASCTANVTFTPAAQGALNGTLTVASSAGNTTVPLAGTGERSLVTHYYRSILGRAPDGGGKSYWESEATRMASLGANVNETWYAMAVFFFTSPEYLGLNRDNNGFVTDLYNTFFNRPP